MLNKCHFVHPMMSSPSPTVIAFRVLVQLNHLDRSEKFVHYTLLGLRESAALVTSERIIFLGSVPGGSMGVCAAIHLLLLL